MASVHSIRRISGGIHVSGHGSFLVNVSSESISLCSAILYLIFGRSNLYISMVGFIALGLESTLPIPQLIRSVI